MGSQEIQKKIQKLPTIYKLEKEGLFYIEGNPRELWFIMHNINVGHRFNKSKTSIMVRFGNNYNWPAILVPNDLKIRKDDNICIIILKGATSVKGWKFLCTIMFHYIKEDFFTFIPTLGEYLANPRICFPLWCDE